MSSANLLTNLIPNRPQFRFGAVVALGVFVLDQLSKFLVLDRLNFSPPGCRQFNAGCGFIELSPIFDLRMVWNQGVSFGMLRADSDLARWGLVAMSFVISGVFLWMLRTAQRPITAWALGLVVGGALGNVIDRIRFGAVADFLDFNGLWFPWVFNVADAAISVGAILWLADILLHGEDKPVKAPVTAANSPNNGQDQG